MTRLSIREYAHAIQSRYLKAKKKEKTKILGVLCENQCGEKVIIGNVSGLVHLRSEYLVDTKLTEHG